MNVKICSRRAAEELLEQGFQEHTAVISFYDPPSKRNAEKSQKRFMRLAFRQTHKPLRSYGGDAQIRTGE